VDSTAAFWLLRTELIVETPLTSGGCVVATVTTAGSVAVQVHLVLHVTLQQAGDLLVGDPGLVFPWVAPPNGAVCLAHQLLDLWKSSGCPSLVSFPSSFLLLDGSSLSELPEQHPGPLYQGVGLQFE